jgi:DDE superfamily endonuclease
LDPIGCIGVPRLSLRRRIWRILDRNDIGRRKPTHQAQQTRLSSQQQADFVEYINEKMAMLGIDRNAVCNFDETNVFFTFDTSTTLERKGAKTVSVRKTDSAQRCTVMLGVSGDGHKFPPLIIFKGANTRGGRIKGVFDEVRARQMVTTEGDHLGFPLTNKYAVQERAWMDTPTMHKWIDEVYGPWALRINGPNMVLLDLGPAHAKQEIVDRIAEFQGFVELLPAHSTSVLQVMDVGINKPFKNHVRDEYDNWHENHGENGEKVQRTDVSHWIETAWSKIRLDTILKTWQHIGWNFNPGNWGDLDINLDLDADDEDFMQLLADDSDDEADNDNGIED